LAEATAGPAFAACAGVLTYVARTPGEAMALPPEAAANGRLGRVGRWLRANF